MIHTHTHTHLKKTYHHSEKFKKADLKMIIIASPYQYSFVEISLKKAPFEISI